VIPLIFFTFYLPSQKGKKIFLGSFPILRKINPRKYKEKSWKDILLLMARLFMGSLLFLAVLNPQKIDHLGRRISFYKPGENTTALPAAGPYRIQFFHQSKILDKYNEDILFLLAFVKNYRSQVAKARIIFDFQKGKIDSKSDHYIIFPAIDQKTKNFLLWQKLFTVSELKKRSEKIRGKDITVRNFFEFRIQDTQKVHKVLELADDSVIAVSFQENNQRFLVFGLGLSTLWGDFGISGHFMDIIELFLQKITISKENALFISESGDTNKRTVSRYRAADFFRAGLIFLIVESFLFLLFTRTREHKLLASFGKKAPIIFLLLFIMPLNLRAKDLTFTELQLDNSNHHSFFQSLKMEIEKRTSIRLDPDFHQKLSGAQFSQGKLPEFPYLWLIGCQSLPKYSAGLGDAMRDFMNQGGIIFVDSCKIYKGSNGFNFFNALAKSISFQGEGLTLLERNHAIYKSFYLISPTHFYGVNISRSTHRTPLIIAYEDIAGGIIGQDEDMIRVGVNILLYMLSGNYKSDQIHTRQILNRLKQRELYR
jgi:hypothetical protein